MPESQWTRVNRRYPCHICGKPDWCRRSSDDEWSMCRRLDTGEGHERLDKNGEAYWLYHHGAQAFHSTPPPVWVPIATTIRASAEVLDQVYGTLLSALTLSARHQAQLRQRGLSDPDIAWRGYRTMPHQGRAAVAKRLVERFGSDTCRTIPGLYVVKREGKRWWSLAGSAGLILPVRDYAGRVIALSVRSDDPDAESRYSAVSSTKYGGPSPGAPIHVPLTQSPVAGEIRLTEGLLKADVATVLGEIFTVGLPGVSGVGRVLPLLRARKVRAVRLTFDADAPRNLHVAMALRQAVRTMRTGGVQVSIEVWDEADGKGIDDLLSAGHTPTVLTGTAMHDELRAMTRSARRMDPLWLARRWEAKRQWYVRRLRLPIEKEMAHAQD